MRDPLWDWQEQLHPKILLLLPDCSQLWLSQLWLSRRRLVSPQSPYPMFCLPEPLGSSQNTVPLPGGRRLGEKEPALPISRETCPRPWRVPHPLCCPRGPGLKVRPPQPQSEAPELWLADLRSLPFLTRQPLLLLYWPIPSVGDRIPPWTGQAGRLGKRPAIPVLCLEWYRRGSSPAHPYVLGFGPWLENAPSRILPLPSGPSPAVQLGDNALTCVPPPTGRARKGSF